MSKLKFLSVEKLLVLVCVVLPVIPFLSLLFSGHFIITRDVLSYILPLQHAIIESPSVFSLVYWDTYTQCGQSLSGNPMGFVYYPLFRMASIFGYWGSIKFLIFCHYGLIGLCSYILFRYGLRLNNIASVFGAVTLGCSGYIYSMCDLFNFFSIPWLLLMAACWFRLTIFKTRKNKKLLIVGCFLTGALAIFGGQLQLILAMSVILSVFSISYLLWSKADSKVRCHRFYIMVIYFLIVAGLIIISCGFPLWQWCYEGFRSHRQKGMTIEETTSWSTSPSRIKDLPVPYRLGTLSGKNYLGPKDSDGNPSIPWSPSIYVGITSLLLLGFRCRRRYVILRRAGFIVLIFTVLMALGNYTPFFPLILKVFPFLKLFRYPEKWLCPATILISFLAALSLDGCLNRKKSLTLTGSIYCIIAGIVLIILIITNIRFLSSAPLPVTSIIVRASFSAVFVLIVSGLLLMVVKGKFIRQIAFCILAINSIDMVYANLMNSYIAKLPQDPLKEPDTIIKILIQNSGAEAPKNNSLFRTASRLEKHTVLSGNNMHKAQLRLMTRAGLSLYGLRSADGLFQNVSERYYFFSGWMQKNCPLLFYEISACKYLIMNIKLIQGTPEKAGFTKLFENNNLQTVLFKNNRSLSRIHFFEDWTTCATMKDTLPTLVELYKNWKLHKTLLLELPEDRQHLPVPQVKKSPTHFVIDSLQEKSGLLKMETYNNKPGMLYFSETYHPYWKAEIDGKRVPIYIANGMFMALYIPEQGTHQIKLSFTLFP